MNKNPFKSGQFLVASPHLIDPNFYRSVVLMIEHNVDGAFGLVVNRPTSVSVRTMWQETMKVPCDINSPVFQGGPIAGPIMLLHDQAEDSDLNVLPGMFFVSEREKIVQLIHHPPARLRVFNGYSGWGPGQLDRELQGGGWLTRPAVADQIFDVPPDQIWLKLTRLIGRDITSGIGEVEGPENPAWN